MIVKGRLQYALSYTPRCGRLLDIGCDYGELTAPFAKLADKVYAVDPNKKVVAEAKKRHPSIRFSVAPAEKLPFKDSFFDVVVMMDVFEHVADEKKTLDEALRVIKPGGRLIFSVPYKGAFRFVDAFNMKYYFPRFYRLFKGRRFDPDIYRQAPWHRHYSLRELEEFFSGKFRIEKRHRGGLLVWPLFWLIDASIYWKLFGGTPNLIKPIHEFISDADYSISYGPLAYHIVLSARPLKKER